MYLGVIVLAKSNKYKNLLYGDINRGKTSSEINAYNEGIKSGLLKELHIDEVWYDAISCVLSPFSNVCKSIGVINSVGSLNLCTADIYTCTGKGDMIADFKQMLSTLSLSNYSNSEVLAIDSRGRCIKLLSCEDKETELEIYDIEECNELQNMFETGSNCTIIEQSEYINTHKDDFIKICRKFYNQHRLREKLVNNTKYLSNIEELLK